MSGMKFTKIVAAFLIAGVVAMLSGFIASKASEPRMLEEDAYPIEAPEPAEGMQVAEAKIEEAKDEVKEAVDGASETVEKVKEEATEAVVEAAKPVAKKKVADPILALLADADIARGQKVSKACAACHTFDQGGKNGVGPNLWDIVGRKKQSVEGFKYSGTLNTQGGDVWTYEELNKYLWKPKKYAPGTKMSYAGIKNKKTSDRAALIAYMRTFSGSPKALPSAAAIAAESAE